MLWLGDIICFCGSGSIIYQLNRQLANIINYKIYIDVLVGYWVRAYKYGILIFGYIVSWGLRFGIRFIITRIYINVAILLIFDTALVD